MLSITGLLNENKDNFSQRLVLIRKKKTSIPPREDDFDYESKTEELPNKKISQEKVVVKDKKGQDVKVITPILIRKKVKPEAK